MKIPISYSLPVIILHEKKHFVAYTPTLDLSSVGKTHREALRMFTEAVEVFFEELAAMGTVRQVLKELGWTKGKKSYIPPKVSQSTIKIAVLA